jgi:hypothetical protein
MTRPDSSVSSVNTLEQAKLAKNCLYIQMPVQEVIQYPDPKMLVSI